MATLKKVRVESLKGVQTAEWSKRRPEEDKQLALLHKLSVGVLLTDSKTKVLVTLIRKTAKCCDDTMKSEVAYATVNRVDAKAQCLQIMQDSKHMRGLEVENRVFTEVKRQILAFRDRFNLIFEDLKQRVKI